MPTESLAELIKQARNTARAILDELERAGIPQTNESSALYLGLVTIQKRLANAGAVAPLGEFAPELRQLVGLCTGKLEPVKPILDEAVRVIQRRPSDRR
jgi:DNA-binding IclR family transcriptional regulator